MSDAQDACEAAIYGALSGNVTWPVHQHVPENTPPPVNILGDMTGTPLDDKDGGDEQIEMVINTVFQGEQRKPVLQEQGRISALLDEKALTSVDGWTIRPLKTRSDAVLMPDGETYLGTIELIVFALKN